MHLQNYPVEISIPEHPNYVAGMKRKRRAAIVQGAYRSFAVIFAAMSLVIFFGCQPKAPPDPRPEINLGVASVKTDAGVADTHAAAIPPKLEIVYGAVSSTQQAGDIKAAHDGALQDVKDIRDALAKITVPDLSHFAKANDQVAATETFYTKQHADDQAKLNAENTKIVALELGGGILVCGIAAGLIWFGQVTWGIGLIIGSVVVIVLCEVVLKMGHAIGFIGLIGLGVGGIALLIYEIHKKNVNLQQVWTYAKTIGVDADNLSEEAWKAVVTEAKKVFSPSTKAAVTKISTTQAKAQSQADTASAVASAAAVAA